MLRQRRNQKRAATMRESKGGYQTQTMSVNLEPTQQSFQSGGKPGRREGLIQDAHDSSGLRTSRSVMSVGSTASEFTKKVTKNVLVNRKKDEQGGMWDKILQFNQSEGRRIALMAAAENGRRKEENKRALDVQCRLHDKRRQHEAQQQQAYIKEQRSRLRKLEAEEDRKDRARIEQIQRVKAEQDEAVAMVKQRKHAAQERELKESRDMMKQMHEEERKDRAKQKARADEARARANELKEDLVRQLAAKEEMKKFEAQEEKLLQKAARKKADQEEKARAAALQELQDKMTSKQKLGEATAADQDALARADEERAQRHQAEYDEKARRELAEKHRKQQLSQQSILLSLEEQLSIKTRAQEAELEQRRQEVCRQQYSKYSD